MSVKIDQAFVSAFIDGDFGLGIAHENITYTPSSRTAYAQLINLPNDTTPLSLADSNETDGIFRIILNWPSNEGSIVAKQKADEILAVFGIGTRVCYDSQCATITNCSSTPGVAIDGWYKLIITIGYYAVTER